VAVSTCDPFVRSILIMVKLLNVSKYLLGHLYSSSFLNAPANNWLHHADQQTSNPVIGLCKEKIYSSSISNESSIPPPNSTPLTRPQATFKASGRFSCQIYRIVITLEISLKRVHKSRITCLLLRLTKGSAIQEEITGKQLCSRQTPIEKCK